IQGELVADPLGLEGVLQPRAELPALFPETGDEDLVSLFQRSPGERLAARFPGGQSGPWRSETKPDAEGGGEEVVDGLPGEIAEVAPWSFRRRLHGSRAQQEDRRSFEISETQVEGADSGLAHEQAGIRHTAAGSA